ncbi:MAG: outer membrane protein assembly factor [Gammaproteobacteria bacterium]|nr:MAG: outer membrane protein assembly factor [Gammaproteobacteria bacterium]
MIVKKGLIGTTGRQLVLTALLWLCTGAAVRAEVAIEGVEPAIRSNVLAYLRLEDETCDSPSWRVRRLHAESENEIRAALEVTGYYDVEVDSELRQDAACWQAVYKIRLGQPVVLRNVSIKVDGGDGKLQAVARACALRPGDVLQHAKYDACRRQITRLAADRGYFSKEFVERRVDVYPNEFAADITLHLVSGPRYVFGETTLDQEVLDDDLIRRFVAIEPGDPYDAERVRRLQRDLIASTYFDQVVFDRDPRGAPHFDVPLKVSLTAGKKRQYTAGVGFATDVGPKLRGGILNRRMNASGHQGEVEASLSRVISDIKVSYRVPLDKARDWVTFDTSYTLEDNDSFKSALFTTGAQRVQQRKNGWARTVFLQLRLEDYETGTVQDDYSKLFTPGIGYAFVKEDYPPRPLAGHRSNVQLRGAADVLISDTTFLQVYGNTKWVFGLWSGARLVARAEAGFTAIDEFADLPASVRFYAGGDVSVRGYAYQSLGPTDPLGAVIGGSNLLVGSVEIDQQVAANWSIAAFIDSGNAYDNFKDFDPATGIGAGIRWFSPLGPVRIDVAVPLEKDAPDNYRFHITLGPDL